VETFSRIEVINKFVVYAIIGYGKAFYVYDKVHILMSSRLASSSSSSLSRYDAAATLCKCLSFEYVLFKATCILFVYAV
jgi:hypothetical protein